MQTHEWEALLADTTPRPWVIGSNLKDPLVDVSAATYEDATLAAHAPAAVAEVVRLRKAIAELEAEERATADDEFYPVHLRDLCRAYADDLARILEGDNDE